MFGLLKQKLSNFIGKLVKKEEEIAEAAPKQEEKQKPVEEKTEEKPELAEKKPAGQKPIEKKTEDKPAEKKAEKKTDETPRPVAKKTEEKPEAPEKKLQEQKAPEKKPVYVEPEKPVAKKEIPLPEKPISKAPEKVEAQKPQVQKIELPKAEKPVERKVEAQKPQSQPPRQEAKKPFSFDIPFFGKKQEQKKPAEIPIETEPEKKAEISQRPQSIETTQPVAIPQSHAQQKKHEPERKMEVKIGFGEQIKSIFTGEVQIKENDLRELLEELQMALLEADVAYEVSSAVCDGLKSQLVGMKIKRGEVNKAATHAMQASLESVLSSDSAFDFMEKVRNLPKPATILFVGPNGAGKTTTMAKLAQMLISNKMSVVFSASDTFRAAAIEQTEVHAKRLGVHVIKSTYGADPAAVAFDAVAYARSHKVDVVLVDSAGRQDTNANLLDELKKMNRVAKPALKIYIGESIGGNAVIDQIKAFNTAIGIDGVILTKLDCDAKGGTALSITYTTKIPIVFFGVGQKYGDLLAYSPHELAQQILT
ncbi:Signal recognition particle receptor FtsY [Candidatus Anstonella stagnisolia]|nr:Signal recognition particle receptor FtsY [Candidatus Anstonella stagnisolia]